MEFLNFAKKFIAESNNVENLRAKTEIYRVSVERVGAGPAVPMIYKFLEGEEIRLHLAEKIWKEGWLIIQEMKEKRAELKRHAEEVLNKEY